MARDHSKKQQNRRKSRPVAPLGDPGALLNAPGAPLGVQGQKKWRKTWFVIVCPGTCFGTLFDKKSFFPWKSAFLERGFCKSLFWSNFCTIFTWFSTPWNHKNINFSWEWHRNQENHEIDFGVRPGAILVVILGSLLWNIGTKLGDLGRKRRSLEPTKKNMQKHCGITSTSHF